MTNMIVTFKCSYSYTYGGTERMVEVDTELELHTFCQSVCLLLNSEALERCELLLKGMF